MKTRSAMTDETKNALSMKRREGAGFPETNECEFWGFQASPRPTETPRAPAANKIAVFEPSPAGKVPSVSEADEEINVWINEKLIVKTIIKNKQRLFNQIMQTQKMLSSSVCSYVASTFPAGEG